MSRLPIASMWRMVATARCGCCAATDLAPVGRIELGDDADNVRVDAQRQHVLVGYGKGALAVIDPATRTKAGDIASQGPSRELPDR